MLQRRVRAFAEEALPDGAEPKRVIRIAEANRAGLAEGRVSGQRYFRLERCFSAALAAEYLLGRRGQRLN
jgi:hypothetical protein